MGSTSQVQSSSTSPPSTTRAVVILSRLQMLSQTVAAALRACGVEADDMAWAVGVRQATHDLTESDSVLLLDDLEDRDFGLATQYLVAHCPARFLVLTARPEGPAWGALLACGVAAVMPAESSLAEVTTALDLVRQGTSPMPESRRTELMGEWVDWLAGDGDQPAESGPEAIIGATSATGAAPPSFPSPRTSEE